MSQASTTDHLRRSSEKRNQLDEHIWHCKSYRTRPRYIDTWGLALMVDVAFQDLETLGSVMDLDLLCPDSEMAPEKTIFLAVLAIDSEMRAAVRPEVTLPDLETRDLAMGPETATDSVMATESVTDSVMQSQRWLVRRWAKQLEMY